MTRNQLANVCGNKMETLLREMSRFFTTKSEWNFYINRDEWKEGFFQGFMDRAELYVGKELA